MKTIKFVIVERNFLNLKYIYLLDPGPFVYRRIQDPIPLFTGGSRIQFHCLQEDPGSNSFVYRRIQDPIPLFTGGSRIQFHLFMGESRIQFHLFTGGIHDPIPFVYRRYPGSNSICWQKGIEDPIPFVYRRDPGSNSFCLQEDPGSNSFCLPEDPWSNSFVYRRIQDPILFVYRRIQYPVHLITGGIQNGIKDPNPFVSGRNPGSVFSSKSNVLTLDQYPIVSEAVKNKSDKGLNGSFVNCLKLRL